MKRRILFPIILLGAALIFVLGACSGVAPEESPAAEEPIQSEANDQPTLTPLATPTEDVSVSEPEQPEPQPAILEQRRLSLEFPPVIRAGDADTVRLTLEVDEMGNITPTAEVDGNVVTDDIVAIPNLYETHYVLAQARFDMAGVEIVPPEVVNEPLLPGEKVTFYWSVRPEDAGSYRGRIWLYLRFTPKEGGDALTRTISAQSIEIEATTFLGFDARTARWAGAIGSFISGLLGMPFFEEIVKWLWGKRKK